MPETLLQKPLQNQLAMRSQAEKVFREMFENTCQVIEQLDGAKFVEQPWHRDQSGLWVAGNHPSGQTSDNTIYVDRALHNGNVFEKAGINYVSLEGTLPPGMTLQKSGALSTAEADHTSSAEGTPFFATGSSFVIHPNNPMAPTVHANYRYFQVGGGDQPTYWWFGGGADLTPAYLFEEDATHFHHVHKAACDRHNSSYYPRFKQACDEYFYIPHRGEGRGIGGIFFDHLKEGSFAELLAFVTDCTEAFIPAYLPLVERRKDMPFTEENKQWQRIVRGRYVEFILTSDRGIRFGLASGMVNQQSIFNCMPALASWEYDDQPTPGSPEAMLREVLRSPRNWA